MSALLALALLAALPDAGVEEAPAGPRVRVLGGLELGAAVLPSRGASGAVDGYLMVHPLLSVKVGEGFSFQLGAPLKLLVLDTPPAEASGVVRAADWDEASDLGQVLEDLTLGKEAGPFWLQAGPVHARTLGFGHLVSRYDGQANADYHPAAGTLLVAVGPIRAELFASDLLGARLFAGELGWDLGRTFAAEPGAWDRYHLSLEVAHDAGRAGLPFRADAALARAHPPPATLAQLDASAVLVRSPAASLTALAGGGLRFDGVPGGGFVLGLALDTRLGPALFSVKAEGRSQTGGYRQGFFGPQYELARYADTGLSGAPQAVVDWSPGFSAHLEARLALGSAFTLGASAEHFVGRHRTDLDAAAALAVAGETLVIEARYGAVGLGAVPRHHLSATLRFRVAPSCYLLGTGGTAFLPGLDGSLQRGVFATLGLGLDFGR